MSIKNHSISIHFVMAILNALKGQPEITEQLLKVSNISPNLLNNPNIRITPDQYSLFLLNAWKLADDEFMSMGSSPSKHGVFALMARQAIHCPTLEKVYIHIANFYNLVSDAISLNFELIDKQAHFSMTLSEPQRDADHMLNEFLFLLWHRFPSWLIGKKIRLDYVDLNYPKTQHAQEYSLMYPCPIHYEQSVSKIVFSADFLTLPVVQTPVELSAYLRRAPIDWLKKQSYYPVFTRRVVNHLENSANVSVVDMDKVADQLHITTRTLRRKLTEEGTSFQTLKDIARRDMAIYYLGQSDLTLSQIAHELGFSEAASFTRAFKKWTGISPKAYKRK